MDYRPNQGDYRYDDVRYPLGTIKHATTEL